MYNKICVIGFLSSLCSARISLNDASKKAYLICENSVKTGKTQVSQILQRYASDHPYQDKFPSHLREASDFFENKYMELISDFGISLNRKKRQDKLDYANKTGAEVFSAINDSAHSDGGNSNHDSGSVGSNPSLHSNNSQNRSNHGSEGGLPSSVTHSIMKDITNCDGNLNAISMSIDQFNQLAKFLSGMITNQRNQQSTINDLVGRVRQLEEQQQKILHDVTSNSPRSMNASMNNIPPPTYPNDTSNGHPQFNGGQSVNSSNQSMNHQQAITMNNGTGNNGNNGQQRHFQMPNNPQPGMMQPGANNNNNSNGFGRNNNNNGVNGNVQRGNLNVANITNQNIQPRFVQQSGPKPTQNTLPNQGRLSPANSHTTNTTKSTNSVPGAQAQQFMNQMNNNISANVMNGMNTNGINMTISNINKNMSNNQLQMMNNGNVNNMNNMNNMNNGMVSIPQMTQIQNLNNIQNGLPRPQMTNVNMNNVNMQNMQQMNQMQQRMRMNQQQQQQQQMNNQQQVPTIPGAATPSRASTMNGLQGTNTLNAGGIPSTSLGMYGSYDSTDGDMAMHGFGNNQSFNSSDAGMTNMQSMPNNYTTTQQPQVPLDAGFNMQTMPRYPDANSTMQPTLQLQSYH